jgi:hypothetical protein
MATDALLSLSAVTDHLRIVGQNYVGLRPIPIDHIVGSVDRSVDFDRFFRPRKRGDLNDRLKSLRQSLRDRPNPDELARPSLVSHVQPPHNPDEPPRPRLVSHVQPPHNPDELASANPSGSPDSGDSASGPAQN